MSENLTSVQASHQRPLEARDSAGLWVKRLSLAAGGLAAVGLAPGEAQAAIVYVTTPVSVSPPATNGANIVPWDVDGDTSPNFNLQANRIGSSFNFRINNLNGANNFAIALPGVNNLVPVDLGLSQVVGPSAPSGNAWGPVGNSIFYGNSASVALASQAVAAGLGAGSNFFGFRFGTSGNYRYGWAEMNLDLAGRSLRINRWAYNDVANTPINVGDEGTPVPGPIGLAGLAAGAAWSRKLRRRIREAA